MAIEKSRYDTKLVIRVEDGTTSSGAAAIKNLNYSQVKVNATDEELYNAGKVISELQSKTLSGIRVVEYYDVTEGQ